MEINNFQAIEINEFFNLVMVWNRGVSFGIFSSIDARIPLIIISLMVGIILIWWHRLTLKIWVAAGVGLIVGGAIGNSVDRLHYGAVADFFDFHAFGHHWPAFNVADMSIFVGVCLLVLLEFRKTNANQNFEAKSSEGSE